MISSGEISARGNRSLLARSKVAFFCSRRHPCSLASSACDWAIARSDGGRCVISGNHSRTEREVLHFLLRERQPAIVALARGMKSRLDPAYRQPLAEDRLLVVSCFTPYLRRVTRDTALVRNDFMAALADEIFIAYASPGGSVEKLFRRWIRTGKRVGTFDIPENRELIEAGATGIGTSGTLCGGPAEIRERKERSSPIISEW